MMQKFEFVKLKQSLYHKFKRTKGNTIYKVYSAQRNTVKAMTRQAQMDYESVLICNIKTRPRAFYNYFKSKQKVKDSIPFWKKVMVF